jgi:hypothetical protein
MFSLRLSPGGYLDALDLTMEERICGRVDGGDVEEDLKPGS